MCAVELGGRAPKLDGVHRLQGVPPDYAEQVTMLTFLQPGTPAAQAALLHLVKLQNRHRGKLAVAALVVQGDEDAYERLLKRRHMLPAFVGKPDADFVDEFFDGMLKAPVSFLIDRRGKLIWRGIPGLAGGVLIKALDGKYDMRIVKYERKYATAIRQKNGKAALEAAEKILAINPANIPYLMAVTSLAQERKDPQTFRKYYEDIQVRDLDADTANAIAWTLVTNRDLAYRNLDIALATAEHALEREPRDGAIIDTYARILYALGKLDDAVIRQRQAVRLSPKTEELKQTLEYYESAQRLRDRHRTVSGAGDSRRGVHE